MLDSQHPMRLSYSMPSPNSTNPSSSYLGNSTAIVFTTSNTPEHWKQPLQAWTTTQIGTRPRKHSTHPDRSKLLPTYQRTPSRQQAYWTMPKDSTSEWIQAQNNNRNQAGPTSTPSVNSKAGRTHTSIAQNSFETGSQIPEQNTIPLSTTLPPPHPIPITHLLRDCLTTTQHSLPYTRDTFLLFHSPIWWNRAESLDTHLPLRLLQLLHLLPTPWSNSTQQQQIW